MYLAVIILLLSYLMDDRHSLNLGALQDHSAEMKAASSSSKARKDDSRGYNSSREAIANKYAVVREQNRQTSNSKPEEKNIASAKVSLLDESSHSNGTKGEQSGLAMKWASMKNSFQNFKANMGSRKFLPLRPLQESTHVSRDSTPQSLDEIFQRLKQPAAEEENDSDNEDGMEMSRR